MTFLCLPLPSILLCNKISDFILPLRKYKRFHFAFAKVLYFRKGKMKSLILLHRRIEGNGRQRNVIGFD